MTDVQSDDPVRLSCADGIAVVTIDNPPLNLLSAAVRSGLQRCLQAAERIEGLKGVVVLAAGKTFIAGADITEFGKPPQAPTLRDLQELLEAFPVPVIAAMHGTALGGGFELALACHFRLAAQDARFGLPEVKLGLLPGAGGTQRLPRLAGMEAALDIVTSGRQVPAAEALRLGIVDTLVEAAYLRDQAVSFAAATSRAKQTNRLASARPVSLPEGSDARKIAEAFVARNQPRWRGAEAPIACAKAIEASATMPFREGLALERELFVERMANPQSNAMRYSFFAERKAARVPDIHSDTPIRPVERVGIVGAGTMGTGITLAFLAAGFSVDLIDANDDALDRARQRVAATVSESHRKGRLTEEDVASQRARLETHRERDVLSRSDLVIEAVFEDMAVKKEVMSQLARVCRPGAILATNTSYLDVTEIAEATGRAPDVVGLHFFSPANVMRLLEIVRARDTASDVLATSLWLARRLGKVGVVVGVAHGFVGNRMLARRQKQANRLVLEGALPWDIDRVLTAFGFPMGPFAVGDLAGLDLGWNPERSTGQTLKERLCEIGRKGQKTGAGYYDYVEGRNPVPSSVTEKLIEDLSLSLGFTRRRISDDELLERCLFPLINEGFHILGEEKVYRASDIDVVWVNGYGWPAFKGGPMYFAETCGLQTVAATLKRLEDTHGDDFTPSKCLIDAARSGGSVLRDPG